MKKLQLLSKELDRETVAVLKASNRAEAALGELKGVVNSVPNQAILLNALSLREAKASSEIENIVTTDDELFRSHVDKTINGHAKEVNAYTEALLSGYDLVKQNKILTYNDLIAIQQQLIGNNAGIRQQQGTVLKNNRGEVVYTPPPPIELLPLLINVLEFINDPEYNNMNPLVKMAVIHHQFESIHPFYDGNGRSGRILNILYLVITEKLDLPVLYLSHYIIENKADYYRLLQAVREDQDTDAAWENWLLYMINGITETSIQTIKLIQRIKKLMQEFKHRIRSELPKIYSQDFINILFEHPYTKITFIEKELNCSRQTAAKYLNQLVQKGLLEKLKLGTTNYYINQSLVDCLINAHDE